MKILVVLTDKEVQSNPLGYKFVVDYLTDKYSDLTVKIAGRCGNTSISGDYDHDIDLIIISETHRLSNFDLFESAYAEYVFTKKPVLICSMKYIDGQIRDFMNRERRFGK